MRLMTASDSEVITDLQLLKLSSSAGVLSVLLS